jgi:hypothetical protein
MVELYFHAPIGHDVMFNNLKPVILHLRRFELGIPEIEPQMSYQARHVQS